MKLINKFGNWFFNSTFSALGTMLSMAFVKHLPLAILISAILWVIGVYASIYESKHNISYF